MANVKHQQKPRFYPILPRQNRRKQKRSDFGQRNQSVPCFYDGFQHADLYQAGGTLIDANYIDGGSRVTFGYSDQSYTNNANWKQRVAQHVEAGSNYSRQLYWVRPLQYSCRSSNDVYKSSGYGTLCWGPTIIENSTVALADQALGRLKNKLNGHIGNAKLGAPLAESREIFRLVRQINDLAINGVKAMLAVRKTRGKSAAKYAADIWLGLGFGVNPLIQDLTNAANAINDYMSRDDHIVVLTGAATTEYHSGFTDQTSRGPCAYGMGYGYTVSCIHKQGIRYTAGFNLKLRSAANYGVGDHLGLEMSELPGVLWELTPFSWVADYFSTVGSWLDDMFFTLPGDAIYVNSNYKYQSETTARMISFKIFGNSYTHSLNGGTSTAKYVNFSRNVLASLPSRALRIKTSDEVAKHSLTKLLNLSAVLAQKSGGPR